MHSSENQMLVRMLHLQHTRQSHRLQKIREVRQHCVRIKGNIMLLWIPVGEQVAGLRRPCAQGEGGSKRAQDPCKGREGEKEKKTEKAC